MKRRTFCHRRSRAPVAANVRRMQTRVLSVLRQILLIWGGLSLLGVIGIVGFVAFQVSLGNRNKIDSASVNDVRFVLNWCELGEHRIDKVLHSYVSSRSFTGDHLDAFAIKISKLEINELISTPSDERRRWYRGDQLPAVLNDAVTFVGPWQSEIPWFPKEAELRSAEFYVYPFSTYFHGLTPTAVELIFVRPSDKMVFYFGAKT